MNALAKLIQWLRENLMLPLVVVMVASLILMSEYGYRNASQASEDSSNLTDLRLLTLQLHELVLDAETGQRGYLLTSDETYLKPYNAAVLKIEPTLNLLRGKIYLDSELSALFGNLSRSISRKLSEMEISLSLKKADEIVAWQSVLKSNLGKTQMDSIRERSDLLVRLLSERSVAKRGEVERALVLGRFGIIISTLAALACLGLLIKNKNTALKEQQQSTNLLQRERDHLEVVVAERTASLSELAGHLQTVSEKERENLASELHDELGALLTTAKLDVSRIKSRLERPSREIEERISHLVESLDSVIAIKRRIIEDLRPSSLTTLGLKITLENYMRAIRERSTLQIQLLFNAPTLDDITSLVVFRVVQEALNNVLKHAKANHVQVSVTTETKNERRNLQISITDDGIGFSKLSIKHAIHGLAGMEHRIKTNHGHFEVMTAVNRGTTIRASLPLPPESTLFYEESANDHDRYQKA